MQLLPLHVNWLVAMSAMVAPSKQLVGVEIAAALKVHVPLKLSVGSLHCETSST
jgi:hypothetical protein